MNRKIAFALCLVSVSALSEESKTTGSDPFSFYNDEDFRPWSTMLETEYNGDVEIKVGYVEDNNFRFGQYNGLSEDGANLSISGDFTDWSVDLDGIDYWKMSGRNLGLDTGSASFTFGAVNDFKFSVGFAQTKQVKNNSGLTPFMESDNFLLLPDNWVAGQNTSDMSAFYQTATPFEQSLERTGLDLNYEKQWDPNWSFNSSFIQEEKEGTQTKGAAFYVNASNGHSAILPSPVDHTTYKVNLDLGYHNNHYNIMTSYFYSKFDNDRSSLAWQNPFSANLGAGTFYPDAMGQMATEPSNDFHQIRIMGNYIANEKLRFSGDMSYSMTSQDETLLPYTINNQINSLELQQSSFDGEVDTTTVKAKVYYRALPKLVIEATTRFEDRDNDSPRLGYQSAFGDAWAPTDSKYQVYNTTHSRSLQHHEIEGTYRLPWASKLSVSYAYEEIDRYNHAVETTEEDIFNIKLRSRPLMGLNTRLEVTYKERSASIYDWGQSYYSLFDVQLINETPDNQRFTNHPSLSQFYLSNRDQTAAKFTLGYAFSPQWQANADMLYQKNEYDKSELGLLEDEMAHVTLSTSWIYTRHFNMSLYYSYDQYELEQAGRAFRGGIEKNPFEIYDPLPQASDPSRNWRLSPEDTTNSIGLSANWSAIPKQLDMDWDYRFVDSDSSNDDLISGGASDLDDYALPEAGNTEHHFTFNTLYHIRDDLSVKFNYQYFRYKGDDWSFDQVSATTIDKVLGTGEFSANEQMHIFHVSVIYRIK